MKYPIFRFRYVNVDSKDHYKITLFVDPKIKEIITNKLARLRMTLRDFGRMVRRMLPAEGPMCVKD